MPIVFHFSMLKKLRILIAIIDFLSAIKWERIGAFVLLLFENGIIREDDVYDAVL